MHFPEFDPDDGGDGDDRLLIIAAWTVVLVMAAWAVVIVIATWRGAL